MQYSELRGLIRARYRTQGLFAQALGISECSLSKKLNGRTEWAADEIRKACELLGISPEHIPRYFFCSMC
jgi:transcriptional regulator with XRE-family HTH domain